MKQLCDENKDKGMERLSLKNWTFLAAISFLDTRREKISRKYLYYIAPPQSPVYINLATWVKT